MKPTVTISRPLGRPPGPLDDGTAVTALVLLWSRDEPERVGEVALVPGDYPDARVSIGRARGVDRKGSASPGWARQRPGQTLPTGRLRSPTISREQLRLSTDSDGELWVENVGRGELCINDAPVERVHLRPGDVLELTDRLLLWCTRRPAQLPSLRHVGPAHVRHAFGTADARGIVGESPVMWALRDRIGFVAARAAHVLVRGHSGTGKELVAQAIHSLSSRAGHDLISRNAATIPDSLAAAELFGNVKNYPNPGMPERPGLVGAADGSTLLLDEFAELPTELQAHLLRVLDGGEYHRLGDSRAQRSDFRLIAATNRTEEHLKHDVLARLKLRVDVPDLNARREDVPLLINHLFRSIAADDPDSVERFVPDDAPAGLPQLAPALVKALVTHRYQTHVRELEALLWRSIADSPGDVLDLPADFDPKRASEGNARQPKREARPVDPRHLSPAEIQACLDRHGGVQDPVWRELGLSSRHVLARLVKKYDLKVRGR